ncbi:MAG: tetratricopeptide repeat protein [Phycisphaerae bacterium]|nr:tetratricopeptide repeat protein [Phycisphaerae bacterium]
MPEKSNRYGSLLVSICLVAAVIAVYWPVHNHDFVKYDDDYYVSNNANIKSGLNFDSIRWAFTSRRYAHNWHPVTWLSHIIDWQLFGDWAGGHHLVNVLFHILNTLLLFSVLGKMTKALWPSAFVAALFALHPLHVESVAWIAERKDLLSTFFWFLTMWAYVRYVENPKLKWYFAALILFMLGLMSKPMLVTLPFVLLLLDYWPLERKISKKLIVEKIPFFLCSFASCVMTFLVQRTSGAVVGIGRLNLVSRINNAIVSYIMYIAKMFRPSGLAVLYPHPGGSLPTSKVVICAALLVLITAAVIYFGRRHKFLVVGWLWYLGTLVPVIGLVQVGPQAIADRYTYITLMGLFVIIGWGAREVVRGKKFIPAFSAVILLGALAFISHKQVKYWKNTLALFERTLAVTKNNLLIQESYANYLFEIEKYDRAVEELNKFLKLKPNAAKSRCNLGCALICVGKEDEAIEQFKLAIEHKPDFALAYNNLAATLYNQGRDKEAIEYHRQARDLQPNNLAVRSYLAQALAERGEIEAAIEEIRFILKARPDSIEMNKNLGVLLERQNKYAEAAEAYRAILQIDPNNTTAAQLLEDVLKKK